MHAPVPCLYPAGWVAGWVACCPVGVKQPRRRQYVEGHSWVCCSTRIPPSKGMPAASEDSAKKCGKDEANSKCQATILHSVPLLPPPRTHQDYFYHGGSQLRETSFWEERAGVAEPPQPKFLDVSSLWPQPRTLALVRIGQALRNCAFSLVPRAVGLGLRPRE